jgi:hypothetical protein
MSSSCRAEGPFFSVSPITRAGREQGRTDASRGDDVGCVAGWRAGNQDQEESWKEEAVPEKGSRGDAYRRQCRGRNDRVKKGVNFLIVKQLF